MPRPKNNGGPSKMDLVRAALKSGVTKPTEIVDHIKKQGVDINAGQVSNYKSLLKREGPAKATNGRKKRGGRRRMAKPATSNGTGYAEKVAQLKSLVKELGLDEVRKLAEVVA